jgi:hypothetical protein
MAYPADVSTRMIMGTFLHPDGQTATGSITFTPSAASTDMQDALVTRTPVRAELNTNGYFEVELPCTDDRDIVPFDWYYAVRTRIEGARPSSYNLRLPAGDNSPVDLSDLAFAAV